MGNYRFRLSDMIPNAWFYKLRDMNTTTNKNSPHPKKKKHPLSSPSSSSTTTTLYHHNPNLSSPLQSYYHNTESIIYHNLYSLPEGANSSYEAPKRKIVYKPFGNQIAQASFSNDVTRPQSHWHSPDDDSVTLPELNTGSVLMKQADVTIPQNHWHFLDNDNITLPELNSGSVNMKISEDELMASYLASHAYVNKPQGHWHSSDNDLLGLEESINFQPRKHFPESNGVSKKHYSGHVKKVLSESVAMVKASLDPQEDFKESMLEMIVENNIKASKELEELLSCYLYLNSDEYHHLIIKAFEQIWFELPHLHL